MIRVRAGCRDDADALAEAHLQGWRVGYRGVVPDEYLDSAEFAANRRSIWAAWSWNENGRSALFTVERDDTPVGFGLCGPERLQPACDQPATAAAPQSERGEVYSFYLHPSGWGSGAAPALMSTCESWLAAEGFGQAVLWVLRDNPRGRAFYEKAGWTPTGRVMSFDLALPSGGTHELHEVEYAVVLR